MPHRILSAGSAAAAAVAALFFFAAQDAAQAARCPLGEIYRPSRGICVSREQAIRAGVYHGSARTAVASLQTAPAARSPKARPQALAEIDRRAPIARTSTSRTETTEPISAMDDGALAFATDRKPAAPAAASPVQETQPRPVLFRRPDPSPFGSLVALEPLP